MARSCLISAAVRTPTPFVLVMRTWEPPSALTAAQATAELHDRVRCKASTAQRLAHQNSAGVAVLVTRAPVSTSCRRFVGCAGIGTLSTGHCHPKVVAAVSEQAHKLVQGQQNVFFSSTAQACCTLVFCWVPFGCALHGALQGSRHAYMDFEMMNTRLAPPC